MKIVHCAAADANVCLQLPASFFAYRKQQHRWTCGPVQLWRKAATDIWASSLPLMSKLDLILCYFGIRKFATHWVSLGFFCTIVPLSVFTPEVSLFTSLASTGQCMSLLPSVGLLLRTDAWFGDVRCCLLGAVLQ